MRRFGRCQLHDLLTPAFPMKRFHVPFPVDGLAKKL